MNEPNEHFLSQFFCFVTISCHVERESGHGRLVDPIQRREGVPITLLEAPNQICLGALVARFPVALIAIQGERLRIRDEQ